MGAVLSHDEIMELLRKGHERARSRPPMVNGGPGDHDWSNVERYATALGNHGPPPAHVAPMAMAGGGLESFEPIDLTSVLDGSEPQPMPFILRRDDGQSLFYEGMINGIHGESGTGKSFVAFVAIVEQICAGHAVMLLDYEDTPQSVVARLRTLGASDADISERLIYVRPHEAFKAEAVAKLTATIRARGVTLVIIDSLGEAFGIEGVNEDKDGEAGPWLRRNARALAEAGPAVVIIDHVPKAAEKPLHASGSKRKRAAIGGASYLVEASTPMKAGEGGRLKLTCGKDRHGTYARNEHVADVVFTPTLTGGLGWRVYAPEQRSKQAVIEAKTQRLIDEVGAAIDNEGRPLGTNEIVAKLGGRRADLVGALALAVGRGLLTVEIDGQTKRYQRP